VLLAGCSEELPSPATTAQPPAPSPGETVWEDNNLSCASPDDCQAGEACVDGVCQIQRCAEAAYDSVPPLGQTLHLPKDQEIVVARSGSASQRIETYEAVGATFQSPDDSALWATNSSPSDLAGGNFLGGAHHVVAVSAEGHDSVTFVADGVDETMALGLYPVVLAGGDIDRDGVDDLGAVDAQGRFQICHATRGECPHAGIFGDMIGVDLIVSDITMADVDGDARDYVPVGGQTRVMSIGRYNAMADVMGGLPRIEVPYRIGDPSSYPAAPETLEGGVILHEHIVFTPSTYRVSDTTTVSWRYKIVGRGKPRFSHRVEVGQQGWLRLHRKRLKHHRAGGPIELGAKQFLQASDVIPEGRGQTPHDAVLPGSVVGDRHQAIPIGDRCFGGDPLDEVSASFVGEPTLIVPQEQGRQGAFAQGSEQRCDGDEATVAPPEGGGEGDVLVVLEVLAQRIDFVVSPPHSPCGDAQGRKEVR